MLQEGGCAAIEARGRTLEEAGVFVGSDWETPQHLVPSLTTHALTSPDPNMVVIESLSELRLLAVAKGDYIHPLISLEQAHHYLTQTMALNLRLFLAPRPKPSAKLRADWPKFRATCFGICPSASATNTSSII